jgi:RHS repeat-associated protein
MKNKPEDAFRCGPMALDRIRAFENPANAADPRVTHSRSSPKGMSLVQVRDLSVALGMNFQMAKREVGARLILPAVVHWKLGHYAALIRAQRDRYEIQDPTFGENFSITQAALDAETSGYYLVPAGQLPEGWSAVSEQEGNEVWGKGNTGAHDPHRYTKCDTKAKGDCGTCAMAQYDVHSMLVSLNIVDTPVGYTPGRGPDLHFVVTYNQRDADQDDNLPYSNLGRKWTFDWLSFVKDNPTAPFAEPLVYLSGGGAEVYSNFQPGVSIAGELAGDSPTLSSDREHLATCSVTGTYQPNTYSHAVLKRSSAPTCHTEGYPTSPGSPPHSPDEYKIVPDYPLQPVVYERVLSDGTKEIFDLSNGSTGSEREIFLTKIVDKDGQNSVVFTYDSFFRLTAVTDALGQVTTLDYAGSDRKIRKVTDPFGRSALFDYNGEEQLEKITDVIGITSEFTYGPGDFIKSMKTPYGTTSFRYADSSTDPSMESARWIEITDPMGAKERVEYRHRAPGIESSDSENTVPEGFAFTNAFLNYRNTFYWSKKAMMDAPGDYTKAQITHWLHKDGNTASGVIESKKQPLENRVWYKYADQPYTNNEGSSNQPIASARVLDNGTVQIFQYEYNEYGNTTKVVDPAGRETRYEYYSNGIDLYRVKQKNGTAYDLLREFTYNSQHLPLTIKDEAGQTVTYTYTEGGNIETMKRVRNGTNEITTFAYVTSVAENGYGEVQTIAGPISTAITTFTYDGNSRVWKVKDSEDYEITYDYDLLDRVVKVTYPDTTYEQIVYDRHDIEWRRDRLGRWTRYFHDALRRLTGVRDSAGHMTNYERCPCGILEGIRDPKGNITSFSYDVQSRLKVKTYSDFTKVNYVYERAASRLKAVIDPKGQLTSYSYNPDNTVQQVTYTNAEPPTPGISYQYDSVYERLSSITDGTGMTSYSYYPITSGTLGAGRLRWTDGPLPGNTDKVSYVYDELGRVVSRSVDGNVNINSSVYDALGRVTTVTNSLGSFNYGYVNATSRVSSMSNQNGQTTAYSYYGNTGDGRLQEIWNQGTGGNTISKFGYTYNARGDITAWSQQKNDSSPVVHSFAFDAAGQLLGNTVTIGGTTQHQYSYRYDPSGNRTTEQVDNSVNQAGYNNLNQLTGRGGGGTIVLEGTLSESGTVAIAGEDPVATDGSNRFKATTAVTTGSNSIPVTATDGSGNVTNKTIQLSVSGSNAQSFTYDLNGNMTGDGARTFGADSVNRLASITANGATRQWIYNGMGQRVSEKVDGNVTKRWIWDGAELIEELDANGNVIKKYYLQGMTRVSGSSTGNYFYTRDHLGSIREMTDGSGALRARYDYDASGRRSTNMVTMNPVEADYAFTGHYYDLPSGLNVAFYRQYDANLGRWLSRDPLEDAESKQGPSLYLYAGNDPVNRLDRYGRTSFDFRDWIPFTILWDKEYEEATAEGRPGDDNYRHCLASCRLPRRFGPIGGAVGVEAWNYREEYPNFGGPREEDSRQDIAANWDGWRTSWNIFQSCRERCRKCPKRQ